MKTVKQVIEELKSFPEEARCHAYEGEEIGLTIVMKDGKHDFVSCSPVDDDVADILSDGWRN